MIIGRLVYAGSKLALCNHHPNTCLWELCGIDDAPNVEVNCYEPMDRLLQRQKAIQKTLAGRHLHNGQVILYDITSVYFESDEKDSKLVAFGDNRRRQEKSRASGRRTDLQCRRLSGRGGSLCGQYQG